MAANSSTNASTSSSTNTSTNSSTNSPTNASTNSSTNTSINSSTNSPTHSSNDDNYGGAEHTYIYETVELTKTPAITNRYTLHDDIKNELLKLPVPPISSCAYRYSVFLRTYSRLLPNGAREQWIDTVLRVIQGTMSCYINHMKNNGLRVDFNWVDKKALRMAKSLYQMKWSPPGRGLYAMGTDHTYKNGNAALNNCYACDTKNLVKSLSWAMDMLMCGGGVGFDCTWDGVAIKPNKQDFFVYTVPDTRQGWVSALELLLRSYIPVDGKITNAFPIFDYSIIRPYGAAIRGFGGTASGPEPLRVLLIRMEIFLDMFIDYQIANTIDQKADLYETMVRRQHEHNVYTFNKYDIEETVSLVRSTVYKYDKPYNITRLIVDAFNSVGSCVMSGNVRRSSLIALADAGDQVFLDLKNLEVNPERCSLYHRSNNTVRFWASEQFDQWLPQIIERVRNNGEPGIANMINCQKYGRYTDIKYGPDTATLLNPCGEINLNSFEPCTLSTICPYNCRIDPTNEKSPIDEKEMMRACKDATFYATVVTTVRHHWYDSNEIIAKNRRIGVSFGGITNIYDNYGCRYLISVARKLYFYIRQVNETFASTFGIPRAIRVTTVKPEGTLSIVMNVNAGCHFAIIKYGKRRVGFDDNNPIVKLLQQAGYESEKSVYNSTMTNIIFPISSMGTRSAKTVSIHEKFLLAALMQRHYSDNSVSFTGDFSYENESEDIERVVSAYANQIKSVSMLPFKQDTQVYAQMPFEETCADEYQQRSSNVSPVNWSSLFESTDAKDNDRDGVSYCTGDYCERPKRAKAPK